MPNTQLVDHLFRHQYGKMVSILTRIFGLQHLDTIEDAVQDTFINALRVWQNEIPEKPEAWLTQAAKNRALDLFRTLGAEHKRAPKMENGPSTIALNELFLDSEITDSQLRMIFAACNPLLHPKDQIAFALKTISGFSQKEIAAALLLKEETVKKRLSRAREAIRKGNISFEIPVGPELPKRLQRVQEVLYLIFNDGFHSIRKELLVREDLCGEAMRLCKMLLDHPLTQTAESHALMALMCFQSARLKSKVNAQNEVVSLREQDRSLWHAPLMYMGYQMMDKAAETESFSTYHYEAAIAFEHVQAKDYESTDWKQILFWYEQLEHLHPSLFNQLNRAVVHLQLEEFDNAETLLKGIDSRLLEQRAYLYHGLWAEYHYKRGEQNKALEQIEQALSQVSNASEKSYLERKRELYAGS